MKSKFVQVPIKSYTNDLLNDVVQRRKSNNELISTKAAVLHEIISKLHKKEIKNYE